MPVVMSLCVCLLVGVVSAVMGVGNGSGGAVGLDDVARAIPERIVLGFEDAADAAGWVTVNDNVMGGRSVGGFSVEDGRLVFSGRTNTNGGGFSSVRTKPGVFGVDGADGLLLRVRGDGREYIASIGTSERMGGYEVLYWARFETEDTGTFETVRIPFDAFVPTFFGEVISGRPTGVDAGAVRTFGLFIYDKKDGPFRLDVEWIGTFVDRETATADADGDASADHGEMLGLGARAEVRGLLEAAIERGVPRFNAGDHGACADIYEVALRGLMLAGDRTDRAVLDAAVAGLEAGRRASSEAERAWAYRRAMDRAYAVVARPEVMAGARRASDH